MAFCSNCGSEISEGASFCGNCGNKINKSAKVTNKHFEAIKNIDYKSVLKRLKEYFLHFYVDYNSKLFKLAMTIFLAIGIGAPVIGITVGLLPFSFDEFFVGARTVFEFLIYVVLSGVFLILILNLKKKSIVKKSNFLMIFWIVTVSLNALVFLADYSLYEYILFSNYAGAIVELLMVVSSAAVMFKNKQKSPVVLIISALSFALSQSSMTFIEMDVGLYKIFKTTDYLIDALESTRYIILVTVLFLLVYIIPRKVSKWLVYVPALAAVIVSVKNLIENFSFTDIFQFIVEVAIVVMFVLFALSCRRKIEYDYIVESKEDTKKTALKTGIISVSSLAVIVITYLLVSVIVCSVQVNKGVEKWKSVIVYAELNTSRQWRLMNEDVFKYSCTKFASQFIDDYSFYETLKENRSTMEKISVCYRVYKEGYVNDDIAQDYSYIRVNDDWNNDPILSRYYNKYMEMQPDIDEVDATAYVNVNGGEITVTVENKNKMPISKCTVECDFTIMFIESGYYTNFEYGRGSEIIEVENIDGGEEVEKTILFDPDDYYDSYGSYIMASLNDSNVKVISIE